MTSEHLFNMNWMFSLRQWFYFLVVLSQVTGLTAMVLLIFYYVHYNGGFSWQSIPAKEFNLHPVLMTFGMIFLYGDAILVYRVFPNVSKIKMKILHAILLVTSLICASIGLKAVFDSHNLSNPPNVSFYSLHSWIGLSTVILFGLQWMFGFIAFLYPKLSEDVRGLYMPSHKFWGRSIFVLAVVAVISGITSDAEFSQLYGSGGPITKRNVINVFGLLVVMFALLILYLVSSPDYERERHENSEHLALCNGEEVFSY